MPFYAGYSGGGPQHHSKASSQVTGLQTLRRLGTFRRTKANTAGSGSNLQQAGGNITQNVIINHNYFYSSEAVLKNEQARATFEAKLRKAAHDFASPYFYATANPNLVRAEGITERTGDIVCHFSTGVPVGRYEIRLFLNTAVTNRITTDGLTDALMESSDKATPPTYGTIITLNGLAFGTVAIEPGRSIKISNVRVNASLFSGVDAPIVGTVLAQHLDGAIPVQFIALVTIALVRRGMVFEIWSKDDPGGPPFIYSRAVGMNEVLLDDPADVNLPASFYVQFKEQFCDAFKSSLGEHSALSLSGTRLSVTFANLPACLTVFVTTTNVTLKKEALFRGQLGVVEGSRASSGWVGGGGAAGWRTPVQINTSLPPHAA